MPVTRKEEFRDKEVSLADFAKALAHPARIAILSTLAKRRECICGDLVLDLPISQSTVSQHLKALKDLGLIQGSVDGPRSRYCINWKVFDSYQKKLLEWSTRISKLKKVNQC